MGKVSKDSSVLLSAKCGRASGALAALGREAALDLSQGHFPTSKGYVDGDEVDIATFGPFTVVLDYAAGTAVKLMDRGALPDWRQRRLAKREFDQKVERVISGTGLVASWGRS